jgi:hypothetical protein
MTYTERAQEWLADRVNWVQYPNINPTHRKAQRLQFFKTEMPLATRVGLVLFGCVTLAICAVAMFFLGLIFWAVITV